MVSNRLLFIPFLFIGSLLIAFDKNRLSSESLKNRSVHQTFFQGFTSNYKHTCLAGLGLGVAYLLRKSNKPHFAFVVGTSMLAPPFVSLFFTAYSTSKKNKCFMKQSYKNSKK